MVLEAAFFSVMMVAMLTFGFSLGVRSERDMPRDTARFDDESITNTIVVASVGMVLLTLGYAALKINLTS